MKIWIVYPVPSPAIPQGLAGRLEMVGRFGEDGADGAQVVFHVEIQLANRSVLLQVHVSPGVENAEGVGGISKNAFQK